MQLLTTKKEINMLALLMAAAYMVSYITRINYGAIISEIEKVTQISRPLLSMAVTGSFVTYGTGQIISGLCGDRFSPKKLISYGLIATVLMNLLIPLCTNPYQMLAVWCINGFAQSFMWPPMVRIMTMLLSDEDYKKVTVKVSWGSSVGTIAVYLISPVIISVFGWKGVFLFSALCGIIMTFVWNKALDDIHAEPKKAVAKSASSTRRLFSPLMICVMVAIILQGMLRDGVTTWMPSYISETYNLSNVISILTGVILPIFSILCFHVSSALYRKTFKNPMTCAGVIFGVGAIASLCLCLLSGTNAAISVFLSAVLTGSMHGVNLILICMVPAYFKKYGNISTVSGVLNSCTYIGSAISTYGIALISEKMGWGFTIMSWLIIAAAGTLICFANIKVWKRKMD